MSKGDSQEREKKDDIRMFLEQAIHHMSYLHLALEELEALDVVDTDMVEMSEELQEKINDTYYEGRK